MNFFIYYFFRCHNKVSNTEEKIYSQNFKASCTDTNKETKERPFLLYLCTFVFILVFTISLITGVCFLQIQKRKRNSQYRYRYFSQPIHDDAFETMQDLPVYRDTTISLQIQESNNTNAISSNITSQLLQENAS